MKFTAALLIFTICVSFISTKEINNTKITVPPGTVQLKDSLYIDKYEVSNEMWHAYTDGWLIKVERDSDLYKTMQPDSNVWHSLRFEAEHYSAAYANSYEFANYPVLGISYEQAVAYCEWRTDRVNEFLAKNKDAAFKSVVYRLPTEKEWELAASGKLNTTQYPYGYDKIRERVRNDSTKMFNCYYSDIDSALNTIQNNVLPIDWGKPNGYGIYNIIGNAGEMVAEKGLSKGGFYDLPVEYCKIKEQFSYTKPNKYLGFRCVCLIENKEVFKKPEGFKPSKPDKKEKPSKKTNAFQQNQ